MDPFTEMTVIIASLKELAQCFVYGKLKKFLWALCPITGCRPVTISFDTCTTRIDSLKRFFESMVVMAPAFLLYLEKQKRVGTLRSFRSPVPDERTFKVAAEVLALASIVAECTTIAQTRKN